MKNKQLTRKLVFLLLAFFELTLVSAQSKWNNFNYPTVTVIDKGAGTNNSANAILNTIGLTESERTRFYNARILSVVKRLYKTPEEVPNFTDLELVFDPNYCGGIAAKSGNPPKIRITNSTHYLTMVLKQSKEELLAEIGGTLTHEVTHAYSHEPKNAGEYAEGNDFFGFIEGIADFVRYKEGYSSLADVTIDANSKWLKGYNGSAFFINYLNDNYIDFAYKLNQSCKTIDPWTFKKATEQIVNGKTIEQLWNDYTTSVSNDREKLPFPVANFNVNKTTVNIGEEVVFTNTSSNNLESSWNYKGKSCVGFTNSNNFKITFDTPGEHKVTLQAKNYRGVKSKEVIVTVKECGDSDNIAIGKTVTASSVEKNEFDLLNVIDNNEGTRWSSNFSDNEWIAVDLESESEVCAVTISWFSCCSIMMGAKDYDIQTSDNGENWKTIKTITDNFDNFNFIPINKTARHIRIKGIKRSLSNFGYSINELKVFGGDGVITLPPGDSSADLTQPRGTISDLNNDSPSNEGVGNLVDNSSDTKYLTFKGNTAVSYNFAKNYVISGYSLTSANDAPERDPKKWVLEGSNDGLNWTAIDTKDNNSFLNRKEKKVFTVSSNLAYESVRFKFTNTSGAIFQLAELELFGKEEVTLPPPGDSLADLTQPRGAISDLNNDSPSNEGVGNLIDNNSDTKYLTFKGNTTVNYNFSKDYVISGYSLTSANDAAERDPASWFLEGSNDGSNWIAIDTKRNNSFSGRKEKKYFTVSGTLGYSKIRFRFKNTSGGIFQLAELEVFGKEGGTTPPSGDSDDLTEPRGNILDSNNDSPTNEGVANLVDNNTGTKYLTFSASTTVNYNFVKGYVISGYSLTSANDAAERDPASWVLEGSNDGSNWTALDRRNNNSFSGRKEKKVFTFNNTTSFSRIRFTFNNTSGNIFQLAELEVFGEGGGTPPPPPGGCEWGSDFLTPTVDFKNLDSSSLGARIFSQEIPNPVSYMQRRCLEVAQILYRKSSEAPKFRKLTFELRAKNPNGESFVAYKWGNDGVDIGIAVSTEHLAKIYRDSGNNAQVIKDEIDGILYHEVTHGYNNSPSGAGEYDDQSEFWAYTEGIADAVRIHAGYHQTRNPDISGRKWLGGYTTTGFFFHYVSQKIDKNFVYKLNKSAKTINPWSFDKAFVSITGKSVQTVWNEYASFVNGNGDLDYDGNYPWSLDCSENKATTNKMNVDEFIKVKDNVRFYPNPIEGEINIIYNKEKVTTVNIRSLQGNVVFSKENVSFSKGQVVNIQINLPSGIYFLEIDGNIEKLIVKKF
ncbi:basic secretory protein-like protein [Tenacibaculum ovolyticum]|uniref:basic secretory protein-like protein n=1 Tax=Tenacibaculum ovolyticum TaxID=104270 RepID=UPI001F3805D3|nr:basic secretory protein-like protein [Tenacibaculum ovolyticum]